MFIEMTQLIFLRVTIPFLQYLIGEIFLIKIPY